MFKIVEGMVSLATELGVDLHLNQEVVAIETDRDNIRVVKTATGAIFEADIVVGTADYHHLDTDLLPPNKRNYSDKYWNTRTMAPSCLLYYVGVNKRLKNLIHHNLFFDTDFSLHASEIYENPKWPTQPLFYVSVPSITDPTVAPEGHENLFILIPVAPDLEDTPEIRERYFGLVMERLEQLTGQSIADSIVYKRSFAQDDFVKDYHAFKGNAYGLANTLLQTAFLKPKLKSKRLNNLYFAGQLTVPGPGVPPALISGHIVATAISKKFKP
jgi:phytoene desaturase